MAPSIRYMNQSAPFWDFVASLENQGTEHPLFGNQSQDRGDNSSDEETGPGNSPFGWGFPFGGPPQHRWGWDGRPHRHRHHHDDSNQPASDGPDGAVNEKRKEGSVEGELSNEDKPPGYEQGEAGPSGKSQRQRGPVPEMRGHCGARGGHCGGRRGRTHGHGPHGPRGFRGPPGPWGMAGPLGDFIQSQIFGDNKAQSDDKAQDFKPDVDVFDTETAFVIHASLPGAKKEDIDISWDSDKSELSITGVTFRVGDEEFLKTLAMDERRVGAFERKIRLGSRASPAQVEKEGIQAKLEDGVLFVKVPKSDQDIVEIMKVDID